MIKCHSLPTALLPLMLACVCQSAPPEVLETSYGRVRGSDLADMQWVASVLERGPEVREALESRREEEPEVWILDDEKTTAGVVAQCNSRSIELAARLFSTPSRSAAEFSILHELGHWYVQESPYEGLPYFVEEGLVDALAEDALDSVLLRRSGEKRLDPGWLWLRLDGWLELGDEATADLAHLGNEVVRRVEPGALQVLAARRASPLECLEAAGLLPQVAFARDRSGRRGLVATWPGPTGGTMRGTVEPIDTPGPIPAPAPAGRHRDQPLPGSIQEEADSVRSGDR